MAKKRKRVYKIMRLTPECDEKVKNGDADVTYEYGTTYFDAECLADYFFMEYYVKSEEEQKLYPDEEYYRNNTCLTVKKHNRVKRMFLGNGKYKSITITDEIYIVSKLSTRFDDYIEVFRTDSLDTLAEVFQLFNEYSSIAWWVEYESFIDSFHLVWDDEN